VKAAGDRRRRQLDGRPVPAARVHAAGRGTAEFDQARDLQEEAESLLLDAEYEVEPNRVLELTASSRVRPTSPTSAGAQFHGSIDSLAPQCRKNRQS
jgi:hypothetical protein